MTESARPKPLVLVADDEADIVELVMIVLDRAGYDVVTAVDGDEALVRARELRPDVCVLDGRMPGRHGFEVLRDLRNDPQTRSIPVVILTATVDEEREISRHGIVPDAFVAKPFETSELLTQLARLLGA